MLGVSPLRGGGRGEVLQQLLVAFGERGAFDAAVKRREHPEGRPEVKHRDEQRRAGAWEARVTRREVDSGCRVTDPQRTSALDHLPQEEPETGTRRPRGGSA